MTAPVVVVGGGGMGRCLLDILTLESGIDPPRWEVVGVVDDGVLDPELLRPYDVRLLGPVGRVHDLPDDVGYLLGFGASATRARIDAELGATGRTSPVLVHPNAHVGRAVHLGAGTVVASHVSIENHVRCGRHVHVNQNSTVGHDSRLGDYTTVSPAVAVSGAVVTATEVFIGTGASIRQGTSLGRGSTVGMGATVVADVGAAATVVGTPARPLRRQE